MAKSIIVQWNGTSNAFGFSKLDRAKLYGYKAKQIVDEQSNKCTSAYLTADGSALIPSGGLAMLYMNDNMATIERSDLKAIDENGIELVKKPSTLGVEQELTGPHSPQDILDHTIQSVYQLEPEELSDELAAALAEGQIFASVFSYRGDYQLQKLFLLQAGDGTLFALIGTPTNFEFIERDVLPEVELDDDEDDMSDDFDFSMM